MPGRRPGQPRPTLPGREFQPLTGWKFPTIADDLSLADDAGGLPLVIRVISELLRAAAEADPLIDVGKASSVDDLRRPTGLSGSDALRGSEEGGSQFNIVTVPELIEHPDGRGFADPPSASQPMQNTGEPRDLENDRLGRRDGMDIPPNIRTEGQWRGDCGRGRCLGGFVVPDRVGRGS